MHSALSEETNTTSWHRWLWQPVVIVFMSNACIMTLELVAGRIIAPHVGVSLYTWTSVIGIVLAGISLGNYVGGRIADRHASLSLLGTIFCLAGLSCMGVLAVDKVDVLAKVHWPIIAQVLLLITALFFIPSAILGTISPVVAKLAVRDLSQTGTTVGQIYAAGAVGSIVGTFLTGFLLISWLGTHTIVWGVAVVLLVLGLVFLFASRWQRSILPIVILAAGSVLSRQQNWLSGPCTRETNYFCIKVQEEDQGGEQVRVLVLDRLVHSYTSLGKPTKLVYGYEQAYAEIAAYRAQQDARLRTLFIGGGGYTFPRYIEAVYPHSEINVIEIDPGVTEIAYERFGLSRDTQIVTYNEDARMFFAREPSRRYDFVFGDAFNDYSVPYHLTTREFNDRVHAWLEDDGLYVVNIIDGAYGRFLRAYVLTMQQTFQYVYLAPSIAGWRESPRSTFVIIGTDSPLNLVTLKTVDAGDGTVSLANQLLGFWEMDSLLSEAPAVALTDRFAPVDQMLAPVFQNLVPK